MATAGVIETADASVAASIAWSNDSSNAVSTPTRDPTLLVAEIVAVVAGRVRNAALTAAGIGCPFAARTPGSIVIVCSVSVAHVPRGRTVRSVLAPSQLRSTAADGVTRSAAPTLVRFIGDEKAIDTPASGASPTRRSVRTAALVTGTGTDTDVASVGFGADTEAKKSANPATKPARTAMVRRMTNDRRPRPVNVGRAITRSPAPRQ